jgi:hypothetical protein
VNLRFYVLAATLAILPGISTGAGKLPTEHLADLITWLESNDTAESFAAGNRLRNVLKTEGATGEALAGHLLDLAKEDRPRRRNLFHLLSARAIKSAEKGQIVPHIDGPYLKRLATLSVPDDAGRLRFREFEAALAYLQLHPEDHEIYWRLRLAATRDAKISALPKRELDLTRGDARSLEQKAIQEDARKHLPAPVRHYGLRDAWAILIHLGVLSPGMTVEAAISILGEPSSREKKGVRWYHDTPRHVNPILNATVKDGKIVKFMSGNA